MIILTKTFFGLVGTCMLLLLSGCSSEPQNVAKESSATDPMLVEAACGQCMLELEGKKGCDLAVRIDGKSYFVDGFTMDQLGDAHADDGMCNVVRKANVTGSIEDGRFVASSFELLPVEK